MWVLEGGSMNSFGLLWLVGGFVPHQPHDMRYAREGVGYWKGRVTLASSFRCHRPPESPVVRFFLGSSRPCRWLAARPLWSRTRYGLCAY